MSQCTQRIWRLALILGLLAAAGGSLTGCASNKQAAKSIDPHADALGEDATPLDAGGDIVVEEDASLAGGAADEAGLDIFGDGGESQAALDEPPADAAPDLKNLPAAEPQVALEEPAAGEDILASGKQVPAVTSLDKAPQAAPGADTGESMGLATLEDVYSSFAKEKGGDEPVSSAPAPAWKPFEFVRYIDGGLDGLESRLAQKIVGSQKLRLVSPLYFAGTEDSLYIVDDGLMRIFRYMLEKDTMLSIIDVSQYFKGKPGDLDVSDTGYIFVADPAGRRVLKFSPSNKLVGIFEDSMNLARPERVYYDDELKKLYVADSVYSRILVFNDIGVPLYAVGTRGKEQGEFIAITGMANAGDKFYVTDRIGLRAQKISNTGVPLSSFGQDVLTAPSAIAADKYGRIIISDTGDDQLKIFEEGYLRASAGGTGMGQIKFRDVSDLWVHDDTLFVLERLNRRIQVLKLIPPLTGG
ncbi:MAG: NHL repeat-containing protein [Pseudomonadota bacterium]